MPPALPAPMLPRIIQLHAAVLGAAETPAVLAGVQSAAHPQGQAARLIAVSWWIMLWGAAALFAVVIGLALYAVFRDPGKRPPANTTALIVGGGVVLPVVTLTALLVYGAGLGRDLTAHDASAAQIEVIGRQWWWEVRYPQDDVVTANEIHIPAGRAVVVTVTTEDVIHSFSVPPLAGKIDLIPGQPNRLQFRADTPGIVRGQCAEFCGAQHARMAFYVVAMEEAAYRKWLTEQRQTPGEPVRDAAKRGRDSFFALGCPECHAIRGTKAQGRAGPDLTHVASRRYLAAGTLENTADNTASWIVGNQRIKPGARMPELADLPPATARDLAAYLQSLR